MSEDGRKPRNQLTRREADVLRMVGDGLSSKHIGLQLGIAPKTVDTYVEHVRMKLGATNRIHMIAIAISEGLLDIGSTRDHHEK